MSIERTWRPSGDAKDKSGAAEFKVGHAEATMHLHTVRDYIAIGRLIEAAYVLGQENMRLTALSAIQEAQ